MMVGTIEYMAPEQFAPAKYGIDGKVSSNLDLWSFGIMVHELLTDSTPFGSRDGDTTAEQIMMQILSTELPEGIDRLPEPYKCVISKCLVTNAKERIRKASELLSYFEGQSAGGATAHEASTRVYPKGVPSHQSVNQSIGADSDATKVYPKSRESTSTEHHAQDQSTKVYADKPGPEKRKNKTAVLVTIAAVAIAVAGGAFWYVGEQRAKELAELTRVGREFKDCDDCPTMVVIPAGSFQMGSNDREADEKPPHQVNVGLLAIGKYEVTQSQWKAVMGNNPSNFSTCGDNCPVEMVSWDDIQQFIQKLNQKTGKSYRLPSEAEWEYAARAGNTTRYSFGDEANDLGQYAWFNGNSGDSTHPVGQKKPNAFGLYDMHGNVWEWTQDTWHDSYRGAPTDGSSWTADGAQKSRVLRGGAGPNGPDSLRSAYRSKYTTVSQTNYFGFRIARTVP